MASPKRSSALPKPRGGPIGRKSGAVGDSIKSRSRRSSAPGQLKKAVGAQSAKAFTPKRSPFVVGPNVPGVTTGPVNPVSRSPLGPPVGSLSGAVTSGATSKKRK